MLDDRYMPGCHQSFCIAHFCFGWYSIGKFTQGHNFCLANNLQCF